MNSLIDLSNVETEEKGNIYGGIENKTLEEQYSCIFNEFLQVINIIKSKKNIIIDLVFDIYKKWATVSVESRRLYIIGAGTPGRLAALITFELNANKYFSIDFDMAGGQAAFYKAAEGAEDDISLAVSDSIARNLNYNNIIIGISASGRTPYVEEYLRLAKKAGALTLAITNSASSVLEKIADFTLLNQTGPEYPRGSTRMKAGTAQYVTLRIFGNLLQDIFRGNSNLEIQFDKYISDIDTDFEETYKYKKEFLQQIVIFQTHFANPSNKHGRILYVGKEIKGLLGVVDGAELWPTYSWKRVDYMVPDLSQITGQIITQPVISEDDCLVVLGEKQKLQCPQIVLNYYGLSVTNVMLKIFSTLFTLQNGWIKEGEMIHLDPYNPNQKLVARRIQILKNLKIVKTDKEALRILDTGNNNLKDIVDKYLFDQNLEFSS